MDLTARLSRLSSAALRSGADAPEIARLLEAASVATMNAVALDILCGEPEAVAAQPQRRAVERPPVARLLDAA
jgi:hypothetical protein